MLQAITKPEKNPKVPSNLTCGKFIPVPKSHDKFNPHQLAKMYQPSI